MAHLPPRRTNPGTAFRGHYLPGAEPSPRVADDEHPLDYRGPRADLQHLRVAVSAAGHGLAGTMTAGICGSPPRKVPVVVAIVLVLRRGAPPTSPIPLHSRGGFR